MIRIAITARPLTTPSARRCPRTRLCGPSFVRTANPRQGGHPRPSEGHAAARRESFDYQFAAEPPLLHRERLAGQQLGLSPGTLNLINAHVGDARLPEFKRYGGLRRNVDHSATDRRSPANDRDHHAMVIIEVDDADLRPHRQAAMRRNQSSETRILKI